MTARTLPLRRIRPAALVGALVLLAAVTTGAPKAQEKKPDAPKPEAAKAPLYVHIETRSVLTYSGDPNEVTILFQNDSK